MLTGLLDRSRRSATQASHQQHKEPKGDIRYLKLLRAGCQRPAVQQLCGAEREVGRGAAMALAGGDSSDLDSGLWGRTRNKFYS